MYEPKKHPHPNMLLAGALWDVGPTFWDVGPTEREIENFGMAKIQI
jgi:hypothetical protein